MSVKFRQGSSGRIQPIEGRYLIVPGTCALCNRVPKSTQELFANLGVELDFYGVIYLCPDCCGEVADFIGFVDPDRVDSLARQFEILQRDYADLEKQLEEAKGLLNARINSAGRRSAVGDGPTGVHVHETEPDSDYVDRVLNADKSIAS